MNHDKMIMGEPPDLAAKPKKKLLIFVALAVLLLVVGTIFFLTAGKKGVPPFGRLDVSEPSKSRNLLQLDKQPLERPISSFVADIQDTLAMEAKSRPSQTKSIVSHTKETKTIASLRKAPDQKMVERETELPMKQIQDTELYEGKIVSIPKTAFSFPAILHFGFKGADVSPSAMATIKDAFDKIADKEGCLILEGHTCSVGSDKSNVDLSKSRIKNVAKAFRELGLGMNIRMSLFAYGESQPVATNETPEGRVQNRRVKIRFVPNS